MNEDDVAQLVKAFKENAERLGIVWTRRYGVVTAVNSSVSTYAAVQLDGPDDADPVSIDCVSICGQMVVGSRVVVDSVPPAGKFVVGVVSTARQGYKLVSQLESTVPSSLVTLTTSAQDVTSTITTTVKAGALFAAYGIFDFEFTVTGNTTCRGLLSVDGVGETEEASLDDGTVTPRATVGQNWMGTLTAGSHSFLLRALKTANVGTVRSNANCTLKLQIFEPL